jgi:hypothetical protein
MWPETRMSERQDLPGLEFQEEAAPPPPPPPSYLWKKIFGGVLLLAVAWLMLWRYWPSDEAEIRAALSELAGALEKREGAKVLALVGKTRSLEALFTGDCRIDIGRPVRSLEGREALVSSFQAYWRMLSEMHVEFGALSVRVDGASATTRLTARVYLPDRAGKKREERRLELLWRRVDGEWRIDRACEVLD